jgi:hypothetical protein
MRKVWGVKSQNITGFIKLAKSRHYGHFAAVVEGGNTVSYRQIATLSARTGEVSAAVPHLPFRSGCGGASRHLSKFFFSLLSPHSTLRNWLILEAYYRTKVLKSQS